MPKFKNSNATFWVIFKQCENVELELTFLFGLRFWGGIWSVTLNRVCWPNSSAKLLASRTRPLARKMSSRNLARLRLNVSSLKEHKRRFKITVLAKRNQVSGRWTSRQEKKSSKKNENTWSVAKIFDDKIYSLRVIKGQGQLTFRWYSKWVAKLSKD